MNSAFFESDGAAIVKSKRNHARAKCSGTFSTLLCISSMSSLFAWKSGARRTWRGMSCFVSFVFLASAIITSMKDKQISLSSANELTHFATNGLLF